METEYSGKAARDTVGIARRPMTVRENLDAAIDRHTREIHRLMELKIRLQQNPWLGDMTQQEAGQFVHPDHPFI